jgi:hypothetical protein
MPFFALNMKIKKSFFGRHFVIFRSSEASKTETTVSFAHGRSQISVLKKNRTDRIFLLTSQLCYGPQNNNYQEGTG